MNREDIYSALFAKLGALMPATFKTQSRRLRHIEDMGQEEMPAVFQVQQDESFDARPNLPTKKVLNVEWWVYVGEPDVNAAPSQKLNPVLDAIDGVLGQDDGGLNVETLGGRVFRASISGKIEIIEGVLGDRALAIIPVRVVKAD